MGVVLYAFICDSWAYVEYCPQSRFEVRLIASWPLPWPSVSVPCEPLQWPTHMQKNKAKVQSVKKNRVGTGRRTDGRKRLH